MTIRPPHRSSALALCLVLAACGSGGDGDTGANVVADDSITRVGTVIVESELGDGLSASAAFFRLSTPLADDPFDIPPAAPGEECDVLTRAEHDEDDSTPPELAASQPTSIGAGQNIVLSAPTGTWGELTRRDVGSRVLYGDAADLGDDLPDALSIDIPGDTFPAFTNVAVPDTSPLRSIGGAFTSEGLTYEWEASDDEGAVMSLVFEGEDTVVDCSFPDTGRFKVPAAAARAIAENSLFDGDRNVSRIVSTRVRTGDSLLRIVVRRDAGAI